jgi:peptidoglycan/LPS O-acetylase OafA/YrhL
MTDPVVAGNTAQTAPENRIFYPALDGLRALAFLLVFAAHYLYMPWGWTGVDLFFVLSGFLITGILFDTRNSPHRVRNFYVRRTLRIFPLYYGLFLVLLLLTPVLHWSWRAAWLAWPLYVGNYLRFWHPYILHTAWQRVSDAQRGNPLPLIYMGHFWSLCVEEQFYLVWPWVVFFVRSRRALLWICTAAVVFVPLMRVFAQSHASQNMLDAELLYRFTPLRIDALLLGGLIALLLRGPQRDALLRAAHWLFWAGTAVVVAYLTLAIKLNWTFDTKWRLTWGLCFVDLYAAVIILVALQPASTVYRLFKLAPLRWLGRMSYGAYLFHDIYHGAIYGVIWPWMGPVHPLRAMYLYALVSFVITLVISWLSFRFFETPFLNLKERWTIR